MRSQTPIAIGTKVKTTKVFVTYQGIRLQKGFECKVSHYDEYDALYRLSSETQVDIFAQEWEFEVMNGGA